MMIVYCKKLLETCCYYLLIDSLIRMNLFLFSFQAFLLVISRILKVLAASSFLRFYSFYRKRLREDRNSPRRIDRLFLFYTQFFRLFYLTCNMNHLFSVLGCSDAVCFLQQVLHRFFFCKRHPFVSRFATERYSSTRFFDVPASNFTLLA